MKRLIIPAYTYADDPSWRAVFYHAADVYAVIVNPDSGPGIAQDPNYVALVARLKASGILVLGYLATTYGGKPFDLVKSELVKWSTFYQPDGVFWDETSSDKDKLPYYTRIRGMARGILGQKTIVVINPGTFPDESYMGVADIACCVETDQETFLGKDFPRWVEKYPPEKFYVIAFSVTNPSAVVDAIDLHRSKYLYLTTAVPAPGASGPEFNIPDTIWPPEPTPVPAPVEDPNWAAINLRLVAVALQAPPGATLADVPNLAAQRMMELVQLRALNATVRLSAVPDAQLLEELGRRLAL